MNRWRKDLVVKGLLVRLGLLAVFFLAATCASCFEAAYLTWLVALLLVCFCNIDLRKTQVLLEPLGWHIAICPAALAMTILMGALSILSLRRFLLAEWVMGIIIAVWMLSKTIWAVRQYKTIAGVHWRNHYGKRGDSKLALELIAHVVVGSLVLAGPILSRLGR